MVEPVTVNTGLIVPNTGDLVGTWGSAALNPDFVAIDGFLGGLTTIAVSNANVTLTAPAGFTATPSAGPTQSQNRVLRITGVVTAPLGVLLPMPGFYTVENMTTGSTAFYVIFLSVVGGGEGVVVPQGARMNIFCDGTNVKFANDVSSFPGKLEFIAGSSTTLPTWIANCTVKPFLICDGTVYNFSTYPGLAAQIGGVFGGNGVTTFGVPDLRGRVPLAYDGTGSRITAAGCGLNGQVIGASLDVQAQTLLTSQLPATTAPVTGIVGVAGTNYNLSTNYASTGPLNAITTISAGGLGTVSAPVAFSSMGNATFGGGGAHPNVQPSLVTGVWLIKT